MPKSVREILKKVAKWGFAKTGEGYNAEYPFGDRNKALPNCITEKEITQALTDIYSLLAEGVEDEAVRENNPDKLLEIGFNQANAAWRKSLATLLGREEKG